MKKLKDLGYKYKPKDGRKAPDRRHNTGNNVLPPPDPLTDDPGK